MPTVIWLAASPAVFLAIYYFYQKKLNLIGGLLALIITTVVIVAIVVNVMFPIFPDEGSGTIEGPLRYPSEGIPKNMEVCAQAVRGGALYCTSEQLKFEIEKYNSNLGFNLEASAGEYYVFARITADGGGWLRSDYRAYYSEYIPCTDGGALGVDCRSHTPIVISVKAGEVTEGVDPSDWYNRSGDWGI